MIYVLVGEKTILADDVDEPVARLRWYVNNHGYAIRRLGHRHTSMHRAIMARVLGRPLKRYEMVDHINHDRLDNRRANLRLVTNSENGHNRAGLNRNNTTGYRGVYPVTNSASYMAVITVNRERRYLGVYPTAAAAARAYDAAAAALVGHVNRGNHHARSN